MIMELPKKFKFPFAEVKDGILEIYRLERFEDLMYELTYALKKKAMCLLRKKIETYKQHSRSSVSKRYRRNKYYK